VNVFPELNPKSDASFAAATQLGQNQSPRGSSSIGGERQYMWYLGEANGERGRRERDAAVSGSGGQKKERRGSGEKEKKPSREK
jgi:hypothetical protein